MTRMRKTALPLLILALGLSACNQGAEQKAKTKAKPKIAAGAPLPEFEGDEVGTPMEERVATIGLLNKRTGESRDLELKPGQELRYGKVVIRLRACERTRPWETFPDEGAFLQMEVRQRPAGTNDAERWERVFSGWLFKNNPAANVVQHPVYDVWVKSCNMRFPGEEEPPPAPPSGDAAPKAAPKNPSRAPQSPAPEAEEPAEGAEAEDDGEIVEEDVIET